MSLLTTMIRHLGTDVRPHDVDDRKVSLEDRLRDGFMAAYRNRVGEDSPEHSEINA